MNAAVKPSIRQLEASDPASNVWVSANAGSGKTHVLVDRVIRLMLNGTEPSRIMCLTARIETIPASKTVKAFKITIRTSTGSFLLRS